LKHVSILALLSFLTAEMRTEMLTRVPSRLEENESTGDVTEEVRGMVDLWVRKNFLEKMTEDNVSFPLWLPSDRVAQMGQVIWFKNWKGLKSVHASTYFLSPVLSPKILVFSLYLEC
jgi:hypothetical protein